MNFNSEKQQSRGGTFSSPRSKSNYFGLPRTSRMQGNDPYDYEQLFPEDDYGCELKANARVWRTYLEEAYKSDAQTVASWNETTDVLLVFAGLFSAVVTTFLVQTLLALSPDPATITVFLLEEQIQLLRAISGGTPVDSVPASSQSSSTPFVAASSDAWINGLWFTSLTCSLVTALICVLVKQWIQRYIEVASGTAHEQAQVRHFRYMGLERWKVPSIIGWLPVLLHASLMLFFMGMVVFLANLNATIAWFIGALATVSYIMYFALNLAPLFDPQCPYTTSLTTQIHATYVFLVSVLRPLSAYPLFQHFSKHGVMPNLRSREQERISKMNDTLDAHSLSWLYSSSSNPSVASVVLQAISALPWNFRAKAILENASLDREILDALRSYFPQNKKLSELDTHKLERLVRAREQLPTWSLPHEDQMLGSRLLACAGEEESTDILMALGMGFRCPGGFPPQSSLDLESIQAFLDLALSSGLRLHWVVWEGILFRGRMLAGQDPAPRELNWSHCLRLFSVLPCYYVAAPYGTRTTEKEAAHLLSKPNHHLSVELMNYLVAIFYPGTNGTPSFGDAMPSTEENCCRFLCLTNLMFEYCWNNLTFQTSAIQQRHLDYALSRISSQLLIFLNSYIPARARQSANIEPETRNLALTSNKFSGSDTLILPHVTQTAAHLYRFLAMEDPQHQVSWSTNHLVLEVFHIIFTHPFFTAPSAPRGHTSDASSYLLQNTDGFVQKMLYLLYASPSAHMAFPMPQISPKPSSPFPRPANEYAQDTSHPTTPSSRLGRVGVHRRIFELFSLLFTSPEEILSSTYYRAFLAQNGLAKILETPHFCKDGRIVGMRLWLVCSFLSGLLGLSFGSVDALSSPDLSLSSSRGFSTDIRVNVRIRRKPAAPSPSVDLAQLSERAMAHLTSQETRKVFFMKCWESDTILSLLKSCFIGHFDEESGSRCRPELREDHRTVILVAVLTLVKLFQHPPDTKSDASSSTSPSPASALANLQNAVKEVISQTRDPTRFHYDWRHQNVACDCPGYDTGMKLLDEMRNITGLEGGEEGGVWEYVGGLDVESVPRDLARVDEVLMHAPYAVPFCATKGSSNRNY